MELLIAGGIALVGYNLSADAPPRPAGGRQGLRRRAAQLGPSNEYAEPGNSTLDATREHVAAATARWQAARDPALTGIVGPNSARLGNAPLPFFRSAKTQNTNDVVKQTRLETFTGANGLDTSMTGTYRNKREVEAMFRPEDTAAAVTSSGSIGNRPVERDLQRFEPGVMHNNVLPADQVHVGRGVGVGPDVAATDGFHPMYRVPVKNVGEYKKNTLQGRVNHGAPPITNTASQAERPQYRVSASTGALVYDMDRRPLERGRAAVLAPAEIPEPDAPRRARVHDVDRFGNPARKGHEVRVAAESRHGGRDDPDRNKALPVINVGAATSGVGAFTHAGFDASRLECQQREHAGGSGFVSAPVSATRAQAGHILPPTQRQLTSAPLTGPAGAAASRGLASRPSDAPRTTLRDLQGPTAFAPGPSAAVKAGPLDNAWRYQRLGREATKRVHVQDRAPLGLVPTTQDQPGLGATALRVAGQQVQQVAAALPTVPNATYQDQVGRRTTPHNKLPTSNPRLQDLGLAAKQLEANPFAQTLWNM